jgi:hypothetical protein
MTMTMTMTMIMIMIKIKIRTMTVTMTMTMTMNKLKKSFISLKHPWWGMKELKNIVTYIHVVRGMAVTEKHSQLSQFEISSKMAGRMLAVITTIASGCHKNNKMLHSL